MLQKRDGNIALPPVDDAQYARLVEEQITSKSAKKAWDDYLPACLKAPDSVSIAFVELALCFHTKSITKVPIFASGFFSFEFLLLDNVESSQLLFVSAELTSPAFFPIYKDVERCARILHQRFVSLSIR